MMSRYLLVFALFFTPLLAKPLSPLEVNTLYHSLRPDSISEQLAFYSLYPSSAAGRQALDQAWHLLRKHRPDDATSAPPLHLPTIDHSALISLVHPPLAPAAPSLLTPDQLQLIDSLANHLSNRHLKGFLAQKKEDLFSLPPAQIDLARALLLYAFEGDEKKWEKLRSYEAHLDLMALQILAYLPVDATGKAKIAAINRLIFYDQKFRFPPHSTSISDVDLYTFLPAVLDQRKGVCLGVSVLYLALAQRIDLPLEIITPPGHIYLRYRQGETLINIETTARGISLPCASYLSLNTTALQKRTIKEVIGLTFINQASSAWQRKDYRATLSLYEQALRFLPQDAPLHFFLGYQHLLNRDLKQGLAALKTALGLPEKETIYRSTLPEDFLTGKVDLEGIEAVFSHVDETRASIVAKQCRLKHVVRRHPKFREGLFHLAITHLQLSEHHQALTCLRRYQALDPYHPIVAYYLAILSIHFFDYANAWHYLHTAETLTKKHHHYPKALRELRHHLRMLEPDPQTLPTDKQSSYLTDRSSSKHSQHRAFFKKMSGCSA